jgi:hypothetical protein
MSKRIRHFFFKAAYWGTKTMKIDIIRRLPAIWIVVSFICISTAIITKPLQAAAVTWNVDSNGYWNAASNWSSNPSLPGASDDVTIDRSAADVIVTHYTGIYSINSLTCKESLVLSGGTLNIASPSTISGPLTLSGATVNINGGTATTMTGASTLSGGALGGNGTLIFNNLTWNGGGINRSGEVVISGGGTLSIVGNSQGFNLAGGNPLLTNGGTATVGGNSLQSYTGTNTTIHNQAEGVFDIQSGISFQGAGVGTINNEGLFKKSTSATTATISWALNNTGTVEVQWGSLSLNGGGTSPGAFSVGLANLFFNGGAHDLSNAVFTNAGAIFFTSGTENFGTPVVLPGTVNFNGGTVNFNGGTDSTVTGAATLSAGVLGGNGTVIFNHLTWNGGGINRSGEVVVPSGGAMSIVGNSIGFNLAGGNPLLTNNGTITVTGSALYSYAATNTTIHNQLEGIIDIQSNIYFSTVGTGTGTINNDGLFKKSAGGGVSSITNGWALNNTGTVDVRSGTLSLNGGGTSTGAFNVSPAASLNFTGGTYTLTGATFANTGTVNFNGGTVNFNGSTATTVTGASTLSAGVIGGNGTVIFNNLTWTGGGINRSGEVVVPDGGAMSIVGNTQGFTLAGGNPLLTNNGTITVAGFALYSNTGTHTTIHNQVEGIIDIQSNISFGTTSTGTGTINNDGLFKKSAGTGVTNINSGWALNNTGTVEVQTGTLSLSGAVSQLSGNTLTAGTWIVNANSTLNITTGGNIAVNQGNVTLDGVGSVFAKINSLTDNQGSFTIKGGRNFTTPGNLANSGELTVGSGSAFSVNGDLTGIGTTSVSGSLVVDSIVQNTLTIGAGAKVTIRPLSGGPMAGQFQITPVPEPSTFILIGIAFGLLVLKRIISVRGRAE